MGVREFRLLGDVALEAVRARAVGAAAAWAAEWGLAPDACALDCVPAGAGLAGVAWDGCWHAGGRQLWLAAPDALQQALQRVMFGTVHAAGAASPPQLAPLAAARARDALGAALACALLGEDGGRPAQPGVAAQPGSGLLRRGAGTVCVTLAIGDASCRLLLDSASVALLAPPVAAAQAALAPLRLFEALAPTPVSLPVRLGQAELGLGTLMSVAVGDVIRLERAVDAPVEVLAPGGSALLRAYPGQTQGMVALDIDGRH